MSLLNATSRRIIRLLGINMAKDSNELFIEILRYGKDRIENGVKLSELKSHIENSGFSLSRDRLEKYFWSNYEPHCKDYWGNPGQAIEKDLPFSLSYEGRFRLLEYEELKGANQSSKTATHFATAALMVSIFATVSSICFSIKQGDSSVRIHENQLKDILQMNPVLLVPEIEKLGSSIKDSVDSASKVNSDALDRVRKEVHEVRSTMENMPNK